MEAGRSIAGAVGGVDGRVHAGFGEVAAGGELISETVLTDWHIDGAKGGKEKKGSYDGQQAMNVDESLTDVPTVMYAAGH